jgi:peroxin-3
MDWGGIGNLLDFENQAGDDEDQEDISEQIEIKYLTLSWWILHVGWKDIAERVRRGVEEVFEGVSLKTQLGPIELHRLISDVRRRVEYEVTFERNERRIK